jgi:hypothetical protein
MQSQCPIQPCKETQSENLSHLSLLKLRHPNTPKKKKLIKQPAAFKINQSSTKTGIMPKTTTTQNLAFPIPESRVSKPRVEVEGWRRVIGLFRELGLEAARTDCHLEREKLHPRQGWDSP